MLAYIGSLPAMEPFILLGKFYTFLFFLFFFMARLTINSIYFYMYVIVN